MKMLLGLLICCLCLVHARPSEQERVKLWHEQGNTWPPTWQEELPGYRKLMEDRDDELQQIPGSDERWENYMQYTQGRMVPTFTARGFDVVKTPKGVHEKLLGAVMDGVAKQTGLHQRRVEGEIERDALDMLADEHDVDCIYTASDDGRKLEPKMVHLNNVAREVHNELLPMHEAWAGGIKLKPTSAYGVRLYQNGSSLVMHHDKVETHVISSIVHILHKGENWAIDIESHDEGKLHSVFLEPGDMLFYESAKCLHGRMSEFKGEYYGSIFLHYMPADKNIWSYDVEDVIANVPPHWHDNIIDRHGSRWAGQAITVDSRLAAGAPERILQSHPDFVAPSTGKHVKRKVTL